MNCTREDVRLCSLGEDLAATLFLPAGNRPEPVLIICHGAGDFKEHFFELAESLAARGVAALPIDMHGHGQSAGARYHVTMRQWVADIQAAIDFLQTHPRIDGGRIAAFGLSSGGTAILEAALVEPRLKSLVALDATVRNSLPLPMTLMLKSFVVLGKLSKRLTRRDLRVPLAKFGGFKVASDPEVNRSLQSDPKAVAAFMSFPFPGAAEAFFVDTLRRVSAVKAPTLVLWGGDDQIDSPETARLLFEALSCRKQLHIIPGNGHLGHLDRNKEQVFALTADWVLRTMPGTTADDRGGVVTMGNRTIAGEAAKAFGQQEKWALLSPFLKQHGREALAYATLQAGMEYFVTDAGYIAYITVRHPVFARRPKAIPLSDPICSVVDQAKVIREFLSLYPRAIFSCISETCARTLREFGFKANCVGYESLLPIQTYNTKGNWKELDLIKRARNEARREGITIREEDITQVSREELAAVSERWISGKPVNDREIWFFARRPVLEYEADVRKFVAYDRDGHVAGFAFYDPIYRDGAVCGYAANILRSDERRFGRLATALHMEAMEKFRPEGKEVLNLLLAPCVNLAGGKFNDDFGSKLFFQLSERYGNDIYNFRGLAFHKAKYRGSENFLYFASNSPMPANDIYLAFRSADITRSYFSTLGRLVWGMVTAKKVTGPDSTGR